jgi:hypothetical protein
MDTERLLNVGNGCVNVQHHSIAVSLSYGESMRLREAGDGGVIFHCWAKQLRELSRG